MASISKDFDFEKWAEITIERWEERITRLGIGQTNELLTSFTHQVIMDSGGNATMISFIMEYYGRMVDMGVGRGVPIGEVRSGRTSRKPKRWYSPALAREIHRLAELLARAYGREAVMLIKDGIEG